VTALAETTRDQVCLSWAEIDVLGEFLKTGASNRELGKAMCLSEDTIKSHMKSIYRKTKAGYRGALAVQVLRGQIVICDTEGQPIVF
jgi:DNA-binding NarL/FixJ family response regulator